MKGIDAYDELVSLIYQCVLDETAWLGLIERLAAITGRREATLLQWNHRAGEGPRTSAVSLCSPQLQQDYDDHYGRIDPSQRFMLARQPGDWYHDVRDFGASNMARDPFYQELFRAHGLRSTSSIKLYENEGAGAYLSLLSALDAPLPGDQHQVLLQRLSGHLMQAARMSGRVRQLELGLAQRQLLLEQSLTAQWLVDAEAHTVFCNSAADRRMSEPGFPLRLRAERLVADGVAALHPAIRAACGKAGPARASWLRLPGSSSELLLTPVSTQVPMHHSHQRPLALVALLENRPRLALLAELFQFTRAESRLAGLIAQGLSPEDCAGCLGVSINTVRTQLRALFAKTGTERQAELAGLFARLG